MHYKRPNHFITFQVIARGMAHSESEFISPYFLFDDNFSFREIKQHITDKGLRKVSGPSGREEKKGGGRGSGGGLMKDILRYLVWLKLWSS